MLRLGCRNVVAVKFIDVSRRNDEFNVLRFGEE
jgi:hypothetical protein